MKRKLRGRSKCYTNRCQNYAVARRLCMKCLRRVAEELKWIESGVRGPEVEDEQVPDPPTPAAVFDQFPDEPYQPPPTVNLKPVIDAVEGLTQLVFSLRRRLDEALEPRPKLLTIENVMRETQLSHGTLWRRWTTGKMPRPLKLGHCTKRFRRKDIEAWIEAGCGRWPIRAS